MIPPRRLGGGLAPSMERAVRPFVSVRALAADSGPALVPVELAPGVFTWGEASNFDQVDAFEAVAADPGSGGTPGGGVDAEDVEYRLSNSLENFDELGQIERMNIQGPDLAEDRRIVQKTATGHRPNHASRMTWIFDYTPVLE